MSNPLFNALGGGMPQGNGPMQMIQQFMQFKQNFKGDPKEEVEKMLAALEEHLDELTTEMSDMSKDAECREERDLVKRYVEKLRDML